MTPKTKSLLPNMLHVIRDKGTEPPFTGQDALQETPGTYLCRQCGLALFRASSQFHSGCGWPSFDNQVSEHVTSHLDADGQRSEILCARCQAHLGHVFHGEGFTAQNIRHCVNAISVEFVPNPNIKDTEEAILAAGCFWGVESLFQQLSGVLKTEVGYTGGHIQNPSYDDVCRGDTGHFEAMRVVYDPNIIDYAGIIKYFFEIHDPFQKNGQGPDIGQQYQSAIFYYDDAQKQIALSIIALLEQQGSKISTQCLPVSIFWPAETYHQDYYKKTGKQPYCHRYTKKFF